jgi:vacuolar protein sorting-associated protein 72
MGILGEGVMGRVARGVPECFVTGKVVRKIEEKEKKGEGEVKKEDGVVVAPVAPMTTVGPSAPAAAMGVPPVAPAPALKTAP